MNLVPMELLEIPVQQGNRELLVTQELLDKQAKLVQLAHKEQAVALEIQVPQDFKDLPETPVPLEQLEPLVLKEIKVKVEHLEHQEETAQQEQQDLLETLATQVQQVLQVQQV